MIGTRPGANNASPQPMTPLSASIRTIVQSKLASTTAVVTLRIRTDPLNRFGWPGDA
jgi:hypothetical protein